MFVQLQGCHGLQIDAAFDAGDFPILIGRSDEADVFIADHWVSRRHCQLMYVAGELLVVDLASRHGTYLNEQKVDEAFLRDGDELNIGLTSLRVLITQPYSTGRFELAGVC